MRTNQAASIFKALSHPHRLALFLRLAKCCSPGQCGTEDGKRPCVSTLGRGLRIGQSTLSHHLKELSRAGLVKTRKCGQTKECWIVETSLEQLADFFQQARAT